jgi:hypothetical protein
VVLKCAPLHVSWLEEGDASSVLEDVPRRLPGGRVLDRTDETLVMRLGSRFIGRFIGPPFAWRWVPMWLTVTSKPLSSQQAVLEMVAEDDFGWRLFELTLRRNGPTSTELVVRRRFMQICEQLGAPVEELGTAVTRST